MLLASVVLQAQQALLAQQEPVLLVPLVLLVSREKPVLLVLLVLQVQELLVLQAPLGLV